MPRADGDKSCIALFNVRVRQIGSKVRASRLHDIELFRHLLVVDAIQSII